ncbi:MAG: acetate uptake transporter [Thermoplasmata archaeon]|nr:acetate uptake transporter [Thermoplasmata archaeon]
MADNDSMPTSAAHAGPVGLLGFGISCILLSLKNAGVLDLDDVILAMGIFGGGLAQLIAGLMEYKNGSTLGTTTFVMGGVFWFTVVAVDTGIVGTGHVSETLGTFCLLYGIMFSLLSVAAWKGRFTTRVTFVTLAITLLLLGVGNLSGVDAIVTLAGAVGVICGAFAMYGALAEVVHAEHGTDILAY